MLREVRLSLCIPKYVKSRGGGGGSGGGSNGLSVRRRLGELGLFMFVPHPRASAAIGSTASTEAAQKVVVAAVVAVPEDTGFHGLLPQPRVPAAPLQRIAVVGIAVVGIAVACCTEVVLKSVVGEIVGTQPWVVVGRQFFAFLVDTCIGLADAWHALPLLNSTSNKGLSNKGHCCPWYLQ